MATGVMLGAIINANIFGELAVIMSSMGQVEKQFQSVMASMNTVMIELKLPDDLAHQVRQSIVRNQPS